MTFDAEKTHLNGLINQSSRIQKTSKSILGMETLCNNVSNLFENNSFQTDF